MNGHLMFSRFLSLSLTRRLFLTSAFAAIAWGRLGKTTGLFQDSVIPCSIKGANRTIGHYLWQKKMASPEIILEEDVVIIGAGISGLSTARYLYKSGHKNFRILDLESSIGGNSQSGETAAGYHPWGAHYLPIPTQECRFLYEFLQESGVITGFDREEKPLFNEEYICHDPMERLRLNGGFQEGLIPKRGVSSTEKDEIKQFFALMETYKYKKGQDHKMAFCIPLEFSSQDPDLLSLDQITMEQFMIDNKFTSKALFWYIDYCYRDDYGAGTHIISAWAGIHYFASRRPFSANAPEESILTWPEGNSFLVKKLVYGFERKISTQALVYKIRFEDDKYVISYYSQKEDKVYSIKCRSVVAAVPQFILKRICDSKIIAASTTVKPKKYTPWVVANLTVTEVPPVKNMPLAWDNVSFYSRSLGYIHANHQDIHQFHKQRNLTYYRPLDDGDETRERQKAMERTSDDWRTFILEDIEKVHPGLNKYIKEIKVWVWGHGMICPTVDYIWGRERFEKRKGIANFYTVHTDQSGISIFEEAFYQGMKAGESIVSKMRENK